MKMRPRQSWTPLKRIIGYCYDEEAKYFDLGY